MLYSKIKPIALHKRHEKDYRKITQETYVVMKEGGACKNCNYFKEPNHGTLGYCNSKKVFRENFKVCERHQFK